MPAAFSAIGAKRSSRIPAAAFLNQLSADLRRLSSAAPRTASRAALSQAATSTGQRAPRVLLAPELGARRVAELRDRVAQRAARRLEMVGELLEVGDAARLDPGPERADQRAEIEADLGRARERLGLSGTRLSHAAAQRSARWWTASASCAARGSFATASRCFLLHAASSAPFFPQTGQSESPWRAWYSSALSTSAAASRERARSSPARTQRPQPPRASPRRLLRRAPRRAARGSRCRAARRPRPARPAVPRSRRAPPRRRRGPTPCRTRRHDAPRALVVDLAQPRDQPLRARRSPP
jgi:hypothetical protein